MSKYHKLMVIFFVLTAAAATTASDVVARAVYGASALLVLAINETFNTANASSPDSPTPEAKA